MSKRKVDPEAPLLEQLQHLRQSIPRLNASLAREVLQVLRPAEHGDSGKYAGTRRKHVYPAALPALRLVSVDSSNGSVDFSMMSLASLLQSKVDACPLFKEGILSVLQRKGHALELALFWDEAVPGNILSPDLRRKSALTYIALADFPALGLETAWLTLALCRTQSLQEMENGYQKYMSQIMQYLVEETKDGFVLTLNGQPTMVFLKGITFLADGDGIRLCAGCYGASGLKCCLHCTNVLSGKHIDVPNHVHISCPDASMFKKQTSPGLRQCLDHLLSLATKTAQKNAERMLGWHTQALKESFLLRPELASKVSLEDIVFDPMHCFLANGIVNQELGLWFQAVLKNSRANLTQFKQYCQTCWKRSPGQWFDIGQLLSSKLWQQDRDYRGDASQTLRALPLAVAFSLEVLSPVTTWIQKEISSLTALYAVILAWLACKRGDVTVEAASLRERQKEHALLFVQAYGWECVPPKMHWSLHLPEQFLRKGRAIDAFATERKHKYFKQHVAVNVKRISDFCSTALLMCVEKDLNTESDSSRLGMRLCGKQKSCPPLAAFFGEATATLADSVESNTVVYSRGQFKMLSPTFAIEIQKAACVGAKYFVLCHELGKKSDSPLGLSHWQQSSSADLCCISVRDIEATASAIYFRNESSAGQRHVSLLMG